LLNTWFVTCPDSKKKAHENKVSGWSLSQEDLNEVANHYFEPRIECDVCHKKFSLQEGVKEEFISDNPFVILDFQYNAREYGEVEVSIGQAKTVKFINPFEDTPIVYLTVHGEQLAACVPTFMANTQFTIFSSSLGEESGLRDVGWLAYGNRKYAEIPIWRKLISDSKGHQLKRDFRTEIIYLESAFEVFVGEYLAARLSKKLRMETVTWLLKRDIGEAIKRGFIELYGKPLSETEPVAYGKWHAKVKEVRDSIVHRGSSATDEQATEAREATFNIITKIDPEMLNHFRTYL
jgi:hypothetical protein